MSKKHTNFYFGVIVIGLALLLCHCQDGSRPRVVSCSATMTEILYEIGARNQVVGATSFCYFPEQVIKDKAAGRVAVVGDFIHINCVTIDSLKPDLILTETDMQRRLADTLRARGYRVLHYEVKRLNDVYACILEIGKVTGRARKAWRIVKNMQRELQKVQTATATLPKTRVYMEINHMGPWTFGSESPLHDLIEIAGGSNVFGDTAVGVFMTSNREVVKRNPEVILSPIWLEAELGGWKGITPLYEIYSRPEYTKTAAVIHSRVSYYDSALLKHYGPRLTLAARKLAFLLHPNEMENPANTIAWELGWIK